MHRGRLPRRRRATRRYIACRIEDRLTHIIDNLHDAHKYNDDLPQMVDWPSRSASARKLGWVRHLTRSGHGQPFFFVCLVHDATLNMERQMPSSANWLVLGATATLRQKNQSASYMKGLKDFRDNWATSYMK
jgi:hypothetical protein